MVNNVHPIRMGRGIQEAQVWEAADALLQEGLRPTIERVRQKIGSGSPNTVSPMLERWFSTLGKRLDGYTSTLADSEANQLPLTIVQAAQQFWTAARSEAEKVQLQAAEAARREIDLAREALLQEEAELTQRTLAIEQSRAALEEALAASRQAVEAMHRQLDSHRQEAAERLGRSQQEMARLHEALETAAATQKSEKEKSDIELRTKQTAADQAEARHLARERLLLSEIDRERLLTRQVKAQLAQERQERAADRQAADAVRDAAHDELERERSTHREALSRMSQEHHELRLELVTMRERAASTENRLNDLTRQLQREESSAAQLRDSHATALAALRALRSRETFTERSRSSRSRKSSNRNED